MKNHFSPHHFQFKYLKRHQQANLSSIWIYNRGIRQEAKTYIPANLTLFLWKFWQNELKCTETQEKHRFKEHKTQVSLVYNVSK
jgi:hypothetical protein